jgi:hypothetical protein
MNAVMNLDIVKIITNPITTRIMGERLFVKKFNNESQICSCRPNTLSAITRTIVKPMMYTKYTSNSSINLVVSLFKTVSGRFLSAILRNLKNLCMIWESMLIIIRVIIMEISGVKYILNESQKYSLNDG